MPFARKNAKVPKTDAVFPDPGTEKLEHARIDII